MKKITILDTSICTSNLGDFIIMDAVKKQLLSIFENSMFFNTSTHDIIGKRSKMLIQNSDYTFVGGTNLLSSKMRTQRQWKIGIKEFFYLNNLILLGVGWKNYQNNPTIYSSIFFKKILDSDNLHSVRDSYTENMLNKAGIKNVINTGCSTMWNLTENYCTNIPRTKAEDVVLTLTDYRKSHSDDIELVNILKKNYNTIYFWPQGARDYNYAKDLGILNFNQVVLINPNLTSFDELLANKDISLDFVGTRLHGGIRALQFKRRTIIIGIDNRAIEKSKDFNLTVVNRGDSHNLEKLIKNSFETRIKIDTPNISKWKSQFN